MAQQQREKEETELKVPEPISSCTQSIQVSPPHLSPLPSTTTTSDESRPSVRMMEASDLKQPGPDESISGSCGSDLVFFPEKVLKRKREKERNRCSCSGCKKKLGLMGFRCRCGEMFCPEHRYSDRHDCGFDYKAAGREAIARENPVVRAAKLLKV